MERGLFIVLEGMDNSGKTTQAGLLAKYLEDKVLPVLQTREPGGTEVGEEIRQVLLTRRQQIMDPVTQALLFYAARREFLMRVVEPNLAQGVTVITDRFEASTYVYQGLVQGVSLEFINLLRERVVGAVSPSLQIIIDITAKESRRRDDNADRKNQQHIFEKWLDREKLRQGYLRYAQVNGIPIVDGMRAVDIIHGDIVNLVEEKLRERRLHD